MLKRDTKALLLNSFFELASSKPINKITVREISENCGVTSQTFYNHFNDKYSLLFWAHDKWVDKISQLYSNGEIPVEEALRRYINGFARNGDFIINACRNTDGPDSYKWYAAECLASVIKGYVIKKTNVEDIPFEIRFYISMYGVGITAMIFKWLRDEKPISDTDLAKYILKAMPEDLRKYCDVNKS